MADRQAGQGHPGSTAASAAAGDSSALLISALAGAVLGAAGLGWWLLSKADQRRGSMRQQRVLRLSRLQESGGAVEGLPAPASLTASNDRELHQKVHQLNEAIEDVRRQLESLSIGRQGPR